MKPKFWMMVAALTIITTLAAQCAAPVTPEKVVETVVVEKEKVVTKEVEKEVVVTKEVEKVVTKEVEKVVTPTPQPVSKRLVVAVPGDPEGFDPISTYIFGWELVNNVYSHLVTHKVDLNKEMYLSDELAPDIAESWEVAPDNKSITFHLNPNATFSDGTAVTADDVKFSLERGLSPGLSLSRTQIEVGGLMSPDQIEVIDDHTVRFNYPDGMNRFSLGNLTNSDHIVVSQEYVKSHGTSSDPWANEYMSRNPMGSGPYMLETWTPGESVVLKARPDYWGEPKPYYDEIHFRIVGDSATRTLLVASGQVDIAYDLAPQEIDQLKNVPNVRLLMVPAAQDVLAFRMNPTVPPFDDIKFRQAIIKAIPYDNIVNGALLGQVTRVKSVCGATTYGYKEYPLYETDLEEAKRLVAESKYPDGASFKFPVATKDPTWITAATLIQANLKEIGVDMEIEQLPYAAYIDRAMNREYPIEMHTMGPWFNDCLYWAYWMFHSTSPTNHIGLNSPKLDEATAASLWVLPSDKATYDKLLEEAVDEVLVGEAITAPVFQVDWVRAVNKDIADVIYWPWYSIYYAYVRPATQ